MTEWRIDVISKVIQFLDEYEYRPTVRGIFYRLVSEEIISNTFDQYKGLVQALGTARKKRPGEKGYISPFAFADDSRYIDDIDDRFMSYQDIIDEQINWLKDADKNYINGSQSGINSLIMCSPKQLITVRLAKCNQTATKLQPNCNEISPTWNKKQFIECNIGMCYQNV